MNKLNVVRELISPAVCLDIEHFHDLFFPLTFSPPELFQRRQVLEAAADRREAPLDGRLSKSEK